MREWRRSLLSELKNPKAPRVVTAAALVDMADRLGLSVARASIVAFTKEAEETGVLRPVRQGIWVNAAAVPAPSVAEAAGFVRQGAIVSLQTVLGDAGVTNNFTDSYTCVVPSGPSQPNTGEVETPAGRFTFSAVHEDVLNAGEVCDRHVPFLHYARATPEAAIVHWFHLALSRRRPMPLPDEQCDVSMLDMERLERLARSTGLEAHVIPWTRRCLRRQEADDRQEGWGPASVS